jgi:hypothetical protein
MTQDIKNTLIAIGDSFTEYPFTWANHLSKCLDMPLIKFSIAGASNKTILHNFYSNWFYNNLNFENCLVIYQSTSVTREDIHITEGARGHGFFKKDKVQKIVENKPDLIKDVFGKTYLLSGYRHFLSELPGFLSSLPDILEEVDPVRDLCFQINMLDKALKSNNNKFLFVLGLHNSHSAKQLNFSDFPLSCETVVYLKDGVAHGIDQYANDLNQVDNTNHPNIQGHKSIVNNLILPKLKELNWTTK